MDDASFVKMKDELKNKLPKTDGKLMNITQDDILTYEGCLGDDITLLGGRPGTPPSLHYRVHVAFLHFLQIWRLLRTKWKESYKEDRKFILRSNQAQWQNEWVQ